MLLIQQGWDTKIARKDGGNAQWAPHSVENPPFGSHRVLSAYLERVSLCDPSFPGTCYVTQVGLELTILSQAHADITDM